MLFFTRDQGHRNLEICIFFLLVLACFQKNIVHQRTFSSLQLSQQQLAAAQSKRQLLFCKKQEKQEQRLFYTADSFHGFRTSVMIEFIMKNQSFKYMSQKESESLTLGHLGASLPNQTLKVKVQSKETIVKVHHYFHFSQIEIQIKTFK